MEHHRKRALVATGFAAVTAVVVTALFVVPALATPPSGLTNTPLARGTNTSDGTIPLRVGTDVTIAQITVVPGGSPGWHSHPGGAIVIVKQGELTVYRAIGTSARSPRTARVRRSSSDPGKSIRFINTGTVPYVLLRDLPACASGRVRQN